MTVQEGLRWLTLAGQWVIIGLQFYIVIWLLPRLVKTEVVRQVVQLQASMRPPMLKLFLNGEELTSEPEPPGDPPPERTH